MQLAKDKHGNIGRKIPSQGQEAKIARPVKAEEQSNVYVSQKSVMKQEIKDKVEVAKAQAKEQANVAKQKIEKEAKQIQEAKKVKEVEKFQQAAKISPTMVALKEFFEKKQSQGETKAVLNALSPASLPSAPADFSASGGNVQYVRGNKLATGGDQWSADYRTQMIVGNPLTRDGVFGPGITDYDRFVKGVDVNQTNIVKIGRAHV